MTVDDLFPAALLAAILVLASWLCAMTLPVAVDVYRLLGLV